MQKELALLSRIDGPSIVPPGMLTYAKSYREAVRYCWTLRRDRSLCKSDLNRRFTRQHVSDYLNDDDLPTRRSLPAEGIADFEAMCGNCFITQWLAKREHLTVLEEFQASKAAA